MIKAYKKYLKKAGDFQSYSSRSDYWWVFLANFIIFAILGLVNLIIMLPKIAQILGNSDESSQAVLTQKITDLSTHPTGSLLVMIIVIALVALAILVPTFSLTARRLRDARLPWWIAIIFAISSIQGVINLFVHKGLVDNLGIPFLIVNIVIYILCIFPTRYGDDEEDDSRTYE